MPGGCKLFWKGLHNAIVGDFLPETGGLPQFLMGLGERFGARVHAHFIALIALRRLYF